MGLKNHLEDETGHILCLGLDLDYLHVDGAERQLGPSAARNLGVLQVRAGAPSNSSDSIGGSSTSSSGNSSYSSSCSTFSEESAISDSEDERLLQAGSESRKQLQDQLQPSSGCQAVRLDLAQNQPLANPSPPAGLPTPEPVTNCHSKVEFALKLGYSEELVLLVLRKLGPDALINDILGELVKLGTKSEMEHQGGPTLAPPSSSSSFSSSSLACSSPSSSFNSSLDTCRLLCPPQLSEDKDNLRPVVVDGSNVAMSHGNKEVFSCQGIQLAVDWFLDRGHRDITVFVPAWRKEQSRPDALITDQEILRRLEKEKILVFTPSRRVQGRRVVCYDDRFIVKLAFESDGIIVSNDNYRDLANEKPEWKKFIDERLLMYSFVNDKFMPPDDPLGRHGPSLDNFLRKKPVIPEHRKQPCPYGKKCTYGHKCKFYHPERGSQPQRSVADELRASAKISTVTSRGLLEHALMVKSQGAAHSEGLPDAETGRGAGIKQLTPSPRTSPNELVEDRLQNHSKASGRGGNASVASSSICVTGLPPSSGRQDQWEPLGATGGASFRVVPGPNQTESLLRCESPERGLSSLVKGYSSLGLSVPQTPERFFPADLRAVSFPSDYSSEGSASSDSFSPDPVLDDSPKCHHHHRHPPPPHPPPPHHPHSGQYNYLRGCTSPGMGRAFHGSHPGPPGLRRQQALGTEEPPASLAFYAPPRSFKAPSAHVPPPTPQSSPASFSSEFPPRSPRPPQASSFHSQTFPIGRNLLSSLWQEDGLSDSRVYEGSPLLSRRSYSMLSQQPQQQINWEPNYQSTPKQCYEPFSHRSLQAIQNNSWHSPWSHSDATGLSAPSPPARSQQSLPCLAAHKSHQAAAAASTPQHQEPAGFARYQDLRERIFVNLCGIFPPDLVRAVMARNPLMMDAQELAAAILREKSHHSS